MMILCNEMVMRKLCNENVMKMVFGLVWDVMKKIGCEIMKKGYVMIVVGWNKYMGFFKLYRGRIDNW